MLRLLTIVISLCAHAALAWALVADYTGSSHRIKSFYEGDGDDLFKIESTINIKGLATLGDAIETVRAVDVEPQKAQQAIVTKQVEAVEQVEKVEEVVEVVTAAAAPSAKSVREPPPEKIEPVKQKTIVQEARAEQVVLQEMVASTGDVQDGGDVTRRKEHLGRISQHVNKYAVSPKTSITASTVVRFSVDPGGKLLWRKVLKSSGSKKLDKAALDTIDRAAPFPPFPPGVITKAEVLRMEFKFKTR